jgi:hypothetical protein
MMSILIALVMGCLMLSSGEGHNYDLNVYLQYLLKHNKPTTRLSESKRLSSFYESMLYIKNFEDYNHNDSGALKSFTLGLNDMSDWLPDEIESRFATNFDAINPTAAELALFEKENADSLKYKQNNEVNLSVSLSEKGNEVKSNKEKSHSGGEFFPSLQSSEVIASPEHRRVRRRIAPTGGVISVNDTIIGNVALQSKPRSEVVNTDKRDSKKRRKLVSGDDMIDSVNWASSSNPKGIPVLTAVRNQGMCGACWAFVAAASVEAQVRILGGKQIPLSVQELIDCDTALNRGCEGGNPLYAFEYTMANALTSWDDYPYKEMESTCHRKKFKSRSSVDGYKRLLSNNQQQLQQYVSMAPVAVGICGTDKSFMYYAKGVYSAASCCSVQNHAVLLVGYGHDTVTSLDYWIALNSWGMSWGERGYIRLLRTNDSSPGQCGLAMNPIIALGGYVLNKNDLDARDGTASIGDGGGKENVHGLPFGASFLEWVWRHWKAICIFTASSLMMFSLGLLALASYIDYIQSIVQRSSGNVINTVHNTGSNNEGPHSDNCSYQEGSGTTPNFPHSYKYHSVQIQQVDN